MAFLLKEDTHPNQSDDGTIKLTEQLVLLRTRAQDLESVRKLNCWGSDIGDVAIVRKMPNLEVCSLSINNISTLRDFAHCPKLKELYVRTNNIQNLGDVHYLKNLKKLRSLWLAENPCASQDNYRMSVLRTLPNLQKLDNIVVSQEELVRAKEEGEEISVPDDFSFSSCFHDSINSLDTEVADSVSTEASENWAAPSRRRHRRRARQSESGEEESGSSAKSDEVGTSGEHSHDDGGLSPRHDATQVDDSSNLAVLKEKESNINEASNLKEKEENNERKDINNQNVGKPESDMNGQNILKIVHDDDVDEESSDLSTPTVSSDLSESMNRLRKSDVRKQDISNSFDPNEVKDEGVGVAKQSQNSNGSTSSTSRVNVRMLVQKLDDYNKSQGDNHDNDVTRQEDKCKLPLLNRIKIDDSLDVSESHCTVQQSVIESVDFEEICEVAVDESLNEVHQKPIPAEIDKNIAQDVERKKEVGHDFVVSSGFSYSKSDGKTSDVSVRESQCVEARDGKLTVNWEEYNRLRKEVGVAPVESRPTTAPSVNVNVMKIRNANILQAALSLVKELDKDSLDILQSTIQAKLNSLSPRES